MIVLNLLKNYRWDPIDDDDFFRDSDDGDGDGEFDDTGSFFGRTDDDGEEGTNYPSVEDDLRDDMHGYEHD